ncbi:hypothetical protein [Paracoccus yeei]|uniref:hypothetical protein n=1 Tax=Paracoccus yeei TaxID=147645 RepID=UPI003BF8B153
MKLPCKTPGFVEHKDGVIPDKIYIQRHLNGLKGYETPIEKIPRCAPGTPDHDDGPKPDHDDGPKPDHDDEPKPDDDDEPKPDDDDGPSL